MRAKANEHDEATDEYRGEQAVREYRVDKTPRYDPMSGGTSGGQP